MRRLKELRTNAGMTQKQIAEVLGVDRTTYSKYESGSSEPNLDMINKIADFFNVSLAYLLGQEDSKPSTLIKYLPSAPLKYYRKDSGLTQQQLADKIGIALNTYISYEDDGVEPTEETLNKIAEIFHVPPEYIWGDIEGAYQRELKILKKKQDELMKKELATIVHRDSIEQLLKQVGHLPDSEIFKIIDIIKILQSGKNVSDVVIEEDTIKVDE